MSKEIILEKNLHKLPKDKIIALGNIDRKEAEIAVGSGYKTGELSKPEVISKKVKVYVKELKASQTEIIVEKAVELAFSIYLGNSNFTKVEGDLGSIISKEGFIMDGHHRWCACFTIDPNSIIGATQISLSGVELVTALNIITKGHYKRNGNEGKGNIKDYTSKAVGKLIDTYLEKGISGKYTNMTPQQVKDALGRVPKANGDWELGRAIMMKNADLLPKNIIKTAPSRIGMPVINKEDIEQVTKMLADGSIDFEKLNY